MANKVKSKKRITEAAEAYAAEMRHRFPGVEPEIDLDAFDGFDVWVRTGVPAAITDRMWEILDASAEIGTQLKLDTDIDIVGTVFTVEPAESLR